MVPTIGSIESNLMRKMVDRIRLLSRSQVSRVTHYRSGVVQSPAAYESTTIVAVSPETASIP